MPNPNPSPATRFTSDKQPETRGRPKEARDRITRKFLNALADDFETHGVDAITKLRETDVGKYIQAVGAVVPKEIEISRPFDGLTDEQVAGLIPLLTEMVRGRVADEQPTVN